jgi:hypothetical protein
VKPLAILYALVVVCKTQNTAIQILADIGTELPDTKVKDIVAESTPRLVSRLQGRGRKRKRENTSPPPSPPKKAKKKATKAKVVEHKR